MGPIEKLRMPPLDGGRRFEERSRHERYEREAPTFQDAVKCSLIPLAEALRKREKDPDFTIPSQPDGLSPYESALWDAVEDGGGFPPMKALVDIDGVLVDTDGKVRELVEAILGGNLSEAVRITREKIGWSERKSLLRCRDAAVGSGSGDGQGVCIMTGRFPAGLFCFPCLDRSERSAFESNGIRVRTAASKLRPECGSVASDASSRGGIVYYFGSSAIDQALSRKMRDRISANGDTPEKLVYVEIRPRERRNFF